MYCPFGHRHRLHDAGRAKDLSLCLELRRFTSRTRPTSHAATLNQMWVKDDEWIDTLQWQEEEAQSEIPTLRIPLEKEGADIMYSVIGPEPKFQAQLIYQAAVIMNAAGLNWTMPRRPRLGQQRHGYVYRRQ